MRMVISTRSTTDPKIPYRSSLRIANARRTGSIRFRLRGLESSMRKCLPRRGFPIYLRPYLASKTTALRVGNPESVKQPNWHECDQLTGKTRPQEPLQVRFRLPQMGEFGGNGAHINPKTVVFGSDTILTRRTQFAVIFQGSIIVL